MPYWKSISAKELTFSYESGNKVFSNKSFLINRGYFIHITGDNGAGKTTLVQLLCGLLRATSGSLQVDGKDLTKINLPKWRENISIIEQFPVIFPCSIEENVHIGNTNVSRERIYEVMKMLGISELASRKVDGKDQLSGGELKKISISRALLRESQLLIFDEPFENLDEKGRDVVRSMLIDKDRTRIYISHTQNCPVGEQYTITL